MSEVSEEETSGRSPAEATKSGDPKDAEEKKAIPVIQASEKFPQLPVVPENFPSPFAVVHEIPPERDRLQAEKDLPTHPHLASLYPSLSHHNASPQAMQPPPPITSYPYFLPPFGFVYPTPPTSIPNSFPPPPLLGERLQSSQSPVVMVVPILVPPGAPQPSFSSPTGGYNLLPMQQLMTQYQHHLLQFHWMQPPEVRAQMSLAGEERPVSQELRHPKPHKAHLPLAPTAPAQSFQASLSPCRGNSEESSGDPESDEDHKDDDSSENDPKKVQDAPFASNIEALWSQKRGSKEVPRKVKEKLEAFMVTGSKGLPRYNCPFPGCPRNYARSEHLGRHLRVHFNGKIYECKQCQRKFSRTDTLLQHYKVHQKGSQEEIAARDDKIGEIKTWLFKEEHHKRSVQQQH